MKTERDVDAYAGCCESTSSCRNSLSRREVMRLVGIGGAAALLPDFAPFAGPFQEADFAALIPADKKLRPEWVRSLYARGAPQVWRGKELAKIGLPVGGICAGTLYLGGDGRLWLWDIFNRNQEGILPKTIEYGGQKIRSRDGSAYVEPPDPFSPLEQGFALRLASGAQSGLHYLDRRGFREIGFRGEYPFGLVEYRDAALPLTVALEAFSPFIPLNAGDSSLPATVMRFTLRNTSRSTVEAGLAGWLENAVCLASKTGTKRTAVLHNDALTLLEHAVSGADETLPDYGTLALAVLGANKSDQALSNRTRSSGTAAA
jgi:hypothetical protein